MTSLDPDALYSGTAEVREQHRFDVEALERYLARHLEGFEGPLEIREFKGGQSNPTYELRSPGARYVLRRKPPGVLLPSAHAVDREFRVIAALNTIGFPVPKAHVLCEDPEVIGTTFYVMERVEGRVFWDPKMPSIPADERRAVNESFIDTLARLHQADPEALGLADFGRPGNYFARQIHRWSKQYRASASETSPIPEMDRLMEWLPENVPEDDSVTLVHGDFKQDNTIVHPTEPRIIAVLDWELSTLGHPLSDLTQNLAMRHIPGSPFAGMDDDALRREGFLTADDTIEAYCKRTGRSGVDDLDFYLAFHVFRMAAIYQGILGRVRDGTAASEHASSMGRVEPIARSALALARRLGA